MFLTILMVNILENKQEKSVHEKSTDKGKTYLRQWGGDELESAGAVEATTRGLEGL